MERSILRSLTYFISTTAMLLGITGTTAHADAIPAYTVTDLGEGTARLSTDSGGNGIVIAPDGQTTYAFTFAPPNPGNPQPSLQDALSHLPALTNAPVQASMTYGNPNNAYSYFLPEHSFLNQNGLFVGTDNVGVAGHIQGADSIVMASQRQADGSFGPLTTLWSSPENLSTHGQIAEAKFLNNQNQVLGMGGPYGSFGNAFPTFLLSDINSHTLINLQDMLPQWHVDSELGLDDQGRILLLGGEFFSATGTYQEHSLLLTPAGLSSDPLTVPEPTAFATLMLGLGGLLLGGRRYSRAI